MCKKISKREEQTVYINCKAKPYLFQSESQNPETIIHEGKNSSLRRKGLGFLVVFHKKPYETKLSNQKRHSVRKTPTKKERQRSLLYFFYFKCHLDMEVLNNFTAHNRFTSNFLLLKEVFLAKKNMNRRNARYKIIGRKLAGGMLVL